MNDIERAAKILFPETGSQTRNIKFSNIHRPNVTAENLAFEIVHACEQIESGKARIVRDVDGHLSPRC